MNEHDLHAALGDLARRGADDQAARMRGGDGLSAGRVVAVAGRRRRRLATVAATAALAVVGAAVVAGSALGEGPAPQPATPHPTATSTPAPSGPAPTPTAPSGPVATVLPTGDPSLAFGACGALATAAPDVPLDDRWSIETAPASAEAPVGGGLSLTTRFEVAIPADWSPVGIGVGIWPGSGPELLVLRDDVVVGTGDLYGEVPAGLEGYDVGVSAHSALYQGLLPLRSCADGLPLPVGQYTVVPTSLVLPLGDDPVVAERVRTEGADAVAAQHPDAWRRVVGAPLDLEVVDGEPGTLPAPQAVDDRAIAPEPSCGAPLVPSAGRLLTLEVPASGDVPPGSTHDATGAFTYAGPGRLRAVVQTTPGYWVLRDGVVVGGPPALTDVDHAVVDLGRGGPLDLPGALDLRSCAPGGPGNERLPAGTYTVVPAVQVAGAEVRTAEGAQGLPSGVVTGEPFELVVG